MLLTILLVIHIIVCILLIGAVLMQQSEGGALGMGGGPSGFMTARGAGNVLTRATWTLFGLFLVLSIALTLLAGGQSGNRSIAAGSEKDAVDPSSLALPTAPLTAPAPTPAPLPDLRAPTAPATDPATPAAPVTQP